MKRVALAAMMVGLVVSGTPAAAQNGTIEGLMTAVSGDALLAPDGATIIRLFGIDAPELNTVEGWGAKMVLDSMVNGTVVQCTLLQSNQFQLATAVQRSQAVCTNVQNNASTDLGLAMLEGGWATAQRQVLRGFSRESAYLDAERTAIAACAGFFNTVIKPWCPIP